MTITKEIKINHINVQDLKTLQIIGSTIIKEGDEIISEKEYAFGLQPNINPSDVAEYQNLPLSEKAKIDELVTPLWNDQVKANYTRFLEAERAKMNP